MNTPKAPIAAAPAEEAVKPANFLRNIIERDLEAGTYAHRRWGGSPGDAAHHAAGACDCASRPSPTATCTSGTPRASA
jgi:glutaminyl-tRNA synthetase